MSGTASAVDAEFFNGLPHSDSLIRFFDQGDLYYMVYGQEAHWVAKNVFGTTTVIKYQNTDNLPFVSLTKLAAESLVRELLTERLFRVEIWEKSRDSHWTATKSGSPGNLQDFDDLLFEGAGQEAGRVAPVVMAVKVSTAAKDGAGVTVGVAFADATNRTLALSEFIDNDLFTNLESLIVRSSAKECLLSQESVGGDLNYEIAKIKGVLSRCNVVITGCKRTQFNAEDVERDLRRLLRDETKLLKLDHKALSNSLASMASLIDYLNLMSQENGYGLFELQQCDLAQFMRLDASAVRALCLMPSAVEGANRNMSLYGLLNKCRTAQGSRVLLQWLKQPLIDLKEINYRQDVVQIFYDNPELRQAFQEDHLKNIPDLSRLARRFQKGNAGLKEIVRFYQLSIKLPRLRDCLQEFCDDCQNAAHASLVKTGFLDIIDKYVEELARFQELVETTVDLEAADQHEYIIKPDFDDKLKELKTSMNSIMEGVYPEQVRVANDLGLELEKKLKLDKNSQYGYFLKISRADAGLLRGRNYIELSIVKSGVSFTTTKMRQLSAEFLELSAEYEKAQGNLVREVIGVASTYCPHMETLNDLYGKLDVFVSFAHVSLHAPTPYIRPSIVPSGGDLILKEARHPCLEAMDDVNFIPNDLEMKRGSSEFQIITGPNMGGKSTFIRQAGTLALMAQIGCFVPCTEAQVPIFDAILARVGAGDSQLKGISTFMAEMLETASILKTATCNSLVIIDELGRGTSTYDGFGLAWAISERLAKEVRALCLFATHFHELTALAESVPTVSNLRVTALTVGNQFALLYRVERGSCDQSFGLHVAQLARFPREVIEMASGKIAELESAENMDEEKVGRGAQLAAQYLAIMQQLKQQGADHSKLLSEHQRLFSELNLIAKENEWLLPAGR